MSKPWFWQQNYESETSTAPTTTVKRPKLVKKMGHAYRQLSRYDPFLFHGGTDPKRDGNYVERNRSNSLTHFSKYHIARPSITWRGDRPNSNHIKYAQKVQNWNTKRICQGIWCFKAQPLQNFLLVAVFWYWAFLKTVVCDRTGYHRPVTPMSMVTAATNMRPSVTWKSREHRDRHIINAQKGRVNPMHFGNAQRSVHV